MATRSPTPQGNTRVTGKEQFYTPHDVARSVVDRVIGLVPDAVRRPWLEPAGGTGSFIDAAHDAGAIDIVSVDIEPMHSRVAQGDFLSISLDVSGAITVSNPPFGRNNSLSVPFFNRSAEYSDYIAFIVPRSWRKWSVTNRLDPSFHVISDDDLTINYVDAAGADVYARNHLRTCVQIWERRAMRRPRVSVADHGLIARSTPADADVALTIFGFGCGTVRTDFPRHKVTTQMYLTVHHPRALEALETVDYTRFSHRVAYTEALSIHEVNYLLNEYLFDDPGLVESPH